MNKQLLMIIILVLINIGIGYAMLNPCQDYYYKETVQNCNNESIILIGFIIVAELLAGLLYYRYKARSENTW